MVLETQDANHKGCYLSSVGLLEQSSPTDGIARPVELHEARGKGVQLDHEVPPEDKLFIGRMIADYIRMSGTADTGEQEPAVTTQTPPIEGSNRNLQASGNIPRYSSSQPQRRSLSIDDPPHATTQASGLYNATAPPPSRAAVAQPPHRDSHTSDLTRVEVDGSQPSPSLHDPKRLNKKRIQSAGEVSSSKRERSTRTQDPKTQSSDIVLEAAERVERIWRGTSFR